MHPIDKAARVAGALYLLAILVGPFSLIYIPTVLLVSGDATATAHNILTHEMLFRLGILGDLLSGISILFLTLALYQLLKGVDRGYAVLMVILGGLMVTPIFFLNALNWVAALLLVHGADFLAAFTQAQRYALAMLFIHLHSQGNVVNEMFWGLWLFPFGILVARSRFLPRLLGVWLIVGGLGYLALSLAGLLFPQYEDIVFTVVQPAFLGEIAIMLWLLIKGANVRALAASAP
jgi:Domain of unknown function (DUF4386)